MFDFFSLSCRSGFGIFPITLLESCSELTSTTAWRNIEFYKIDALGIQGKTVKYPAFVNDRLSIPLSLIMILLCLVRNFQISIWFFYWRVSRPLELRALVLYYIDILYGASQKTNIPFSMNSVHVIHADDLKGCAFCVWSYFVTTYIV